MARTLSLLRRAARYTRPLLLVAVLVGGALAWKQPALRQKIGLPMPSGERVTAAFALCDAPGYSPNCVVDGDTFRIINRRIRVQGIDAPERDGRCDAERTLARRATADLLAWLDRGPFQMLPADQAGHDQYGRELQTVWRQAADGSRDDLGDHMRRIGSARRYDSRAKVDWC